MNYPDFDDGESTKVSTPIFGTDIEPYGQPNLMYGRNAITATEVTTEHYRRLDVRDIILRYCRDGESWRALNGDNGWYISDQESGTIRLRTPDDYDETVSR